MPRRCVAVVFHTSLVVHRTGDVYNLTFHTTGRAVVPCDLCLDDMELDVTADNRLSVQLGEVHSDEDEHVVVSRQEGILDVAWHVYEFIALEIPLRHVHAPGKCDPAMTSVLAEYSAARSGSGNAEQTMDSRWEALLRLKEQKD